MHACLAAAAKSRVRLPVAAAIVIAALLLYGMRAER